MLILAGEKRVPHSSQRWYKIRQVVADKHRAHYLLFGETGNHTTAESLLQQAIALSDTVGDRREANSQRLI